MGRVSACMKSLSPDLLCVTVTLSIMGEGGLRLAENINTVKSWPLNPGWTHPPLPSRQPVILRGG